MKVLWFVVDVFGVVNDLCQGTSCERVTLEAAYHSKTQALRRQIGMIIRKLIPHTSAEAAYVLLLDSSETEHF